MKSFYFLVFIVLLALGIVTLGQSLEGRGTTVNRLVGVIMILVSIISYLLMQMKFNEEKYKKQRSWKRNW